MNDPRTFTDFSDDPRNNGFGTSRPNPYDDYETEEIEQPEEEIDLENEILEDE